MVRRTKTVFSPKNTQFDDFPVLNHLKKKYRTNSAIACVTVRKPSNDNNNNNPN